MKANPNILFKHEVPINDQITIKIPTVEEVMDDEENYYGLVAAFTAMPIDMMVQLDDLGIDFTTIDEWQLFQLLFPGIQQQDTSLIFGDLDLSKFEYAVNQNNQELMFADLETGNMIDKGIYLMISDMLRKINHTEKNTKRPGNKEAKDYLIERERRKMKRRKNKAYESQLEPLVVAMVNHNHFKYKFDEVSELTIYQFNESLRQIMHTVNYENIMRGVYAGTISTSDMKKEDLTWIMQKSS